MSLTDRIHNPDRRQTDVTPVVERRGGEERRLSPMARRVLANKEASLRTGGERPMGTDGSVAA